MHPDPLDDIRQLLDQLPQPRDFVSAGPGEGFEDLGRLEQLSDWLKAWSGGKPAFSRPTIAIFAGAHGFLPQGVTTENDASVRAFMTRAGDGSGLMPRLCVASNIGLKVLELALDHPTGDFSLQSAFNPRGVAATIAFGMEAAAGGNDLLCLSAAGAGGDVAAAALMAGLTGGDGKIWSEPSAPTHLRLRQESLIDNALARMARNGAGDGLAMLTELGGREIAAIAGTIIAARMEKVPVVLDGQPALAAALALNASRSGAIDHCLLAARPIPAPAAAAAQRAGLAWISERSLAAAPGVDAALAVQTLRLALHQ